MSCSLACTGSRTAGYRPFHAATEQARLSAPARAAPAQQQTAIRSGEGRNVRPDRFECRCRTAGACAPCLISLFRCAPGNRPGMRGGGHLPKTKAARRQRPFASLLLHESVSLPSSSSSSLARRADERMRAGGADSSAAAAATRLEGSRRGTPEA